MHWYLTALKQYSTFQGRSQRKEFWTFLLVNLIMGLLIEFGINFFQKKFHVKLNGLSDIYMLAMLLPTIAVGVRRMHDIGLSGWWILTPPFGELIFALLDSQPGDNRFGSNPKGILSKLPSFIPERYLLPIGRSSWAIAAGYLGLLSALFIPAPFAVLCGIKALKDISKYPEKTGKPRAIFGVIMGSIGTLLLLSVCILFIKQYK